ncbi:MAG TPA: glycosyltransferase family 9 protein, partial [Blastocatellia bacterium]|nr:glycosyltransferase family 9 protein [Blastocatellia bacterium]
RLLTWIELLQCVRDLTSGLNPGEYLIVDPDSRLTQLGLLPVDLLERSWHEREQDRATQRRDYLLFPSREYGSGTSLSLSQLSSLWLDEVFGESGPTHPSVSLRRNDIDVARNLVTGMRRGSRPIIAINFGVGENQRKRVSGEFEATLVSRLIQDGAVIVLDKGAGDEERSRANLIVGEATRMERDGRLVRAVEVNGRLNNARGGFDAEILVWSGGIGMLGALIGESDLYIGYDSAGQHIAAALGVKSISVFAGFSSQRVLERWRPTGRAETRQVAFDTLSGAVGANELIAKVQRHAAEMLSAAN